MKTVVFPGQGAQFVGMGKDIFPLFPKEVQTASDILGYDLIELCTDDPEKKLNQTQYTQPSLFVVNALTYSKNYQEKPDFLAGHSLGEYNALLAAEVFDFETGLQLVKKRGEVMGKATGGSMMAIINIDSNTIKEVLETNGFNTIDLANYNTPKQTVISGPESDILSVSKFLDDKGAFCIPLKVSAAFHSRYMADAEQEFKKFIESFSFASPKIEVIANATAQSYQTEKVVETLSKQITSSVLWVDSIRFLLEKGVEIFEEIGDRNILSKMINDINNN